MTEKLAVQTATDRYVYIETGKGQQGSGVVIYTGLILTCFHNLEAHAGIKVRGKRAEIVKVDPKHDLLLVSVKTKRFDMVQLGSVELADTVVFVSNPNLLSGVLMFGRVGYVSKKMIVHDGHGAPGVSGSGLFNLQSELVGINYAVRGEDVTGNWLTIATPANKFRKVLSGC